MKVIFIFAIVEDKGVVGLDVEILDIWILGYKDIGIFVRILGYEWKSSCLPSGHSIS